MYKMITSCRRDARGIELVRVINVEVMRRGYKCMVVQGRRQIDLVNTSEKVLAFSEVMEATSHEVVDSAAAAAALVFLLCWNARL